MTETKQISIIVKLGAALFLWIGLLGLFSNAEPAITSFFMGFGAALWAYMEHNRDSTFLFFMAAILAIIFIGAFIMHIS